MADRADIIRRRLLRARQQAALRKSARVPSSAVKQAPATAKVVSSPAKTVSPHAKVAPPQAAVMQKPQAPAMQKSQSPTPQAPAMQKSQSPTPQAPQPQKPQTPTPPLAPKAPKGGIRRERKMMKLRCARRARFFNYLLGLILLAAGAYVYLFRPAEISMLYNLVSADYIAMALVFLGIIVMLYAETKRRGAHYYITQYRIVSVCGLLRKREHGLQLSLVESVRIQQSLLDRILGIGNVEVKASTETLNIIKIGNPSRVESLILAEMSGSGKGEDRPAGR